MTPSLALSPGLILTLGFEWGNLIPLILVALAVIYQIVRGLSEAGRTDSTESSESNTQEGGLSSEERLRQLAERRRQQLRELAERRRQAGGTGGGERGGEREMQPQRAEARDASARPARQSGPPVTPPRAPSRPREASQPWQREENQRRAERQAERDRETDARAARNREIAAANRTREAAEAEQERQQRLRRAAERSARQKKSRSTTFGHRSRGGSTSAPRVRRPAPLVSPKHEITTGEIGTGQATQPAGKQRIGHAAWVRQLRNAEPHSLQRAIVLKEVLDVPVGLRQQMWSSPPAGDRPTD